MELRRGKMQKYNISRILALVCLISFAGFQTVVYAENESDAVKENIQTLKKTKSCAGCDLRGAELIRMDLSGVNLEGADLTGAKLFLSNLSGANLRNAHLQKTSFGGADLADADLRGADLQGVDLNGAYLMGAKLDGEVVKTKPYEEEISGSTEKMTLDDTAESTSKKENKGAAVGSKIDDGERLATGPKKAASDSRTSDTKNPESMASKDSPLVKGVAPESQVKENVIQEATTNTAPKEAAVKETAQLSEDQGSAAASAQAGKSQNAEQEMTGKRETLASSVPAQEKNIAEKDPVIAKQATKQTETGKNTPADTVQPAEISSDKAKNLKTLLETKKCYKCDLAGVDLSGKNLSEADLEGADLKGSNLEKTDLAKANLKGASLVNANLKKADLKRADLYKANLSGADLTDAAMENATIDEALFEGVIGKKM
jgi:uncharacterized protein YjbI with pentapeptide repeats